jgi:DNA-binding XRE family transcriptional regulator
LPIRSASQLNDSSAAAQAGKGFDLKRELGLRIKALRTERQITQEDLTDRSGMFRTYMSRIESGRANPTLTMLHDIAAAFDVDIRDLFAPAGDGVPARVSAAGPRMSRGRVSK